MNSYIIEAIKRINPKSQRIVENNKFYYQNRIIDLATQLYVMQPKNLKSLYSWVAEDIVEDKERAQHYGVIVGTKIGYRTSTKDKQYYSKLAKVKREIKHIVRKMIVDL